MDYRSPNIVSYVTLEKIDKFYQDFDTFFALVFHDLALSALPLKNVPLKYMLKAKTMFMS